MASCGQSYKLQSLAVTPGALAASGEQQIVLLGIGAYQQLTVTASFSNSKTQDVTNDPNTHYQLNSSSMPADLNPAVAVPLSSILISNSGKVTVLSKACTFDTEPIPGTSDAQWTYFGYPYKLQVTYTNNGVTAQAFLDVQVVNARYCWDGTDVVGGNSATPFTGFTGNLIEGWGS
jgi:hypothetical protein